MSTKGKELEDEPRKIRARQAATVVPDRREDLSNGLETVLEVCHQRVSPCTGQTDNEDLKTEKSKDEPLERTKPELLRA